MLGKIKIGFKIIFKRKKEGGNETTTIELILLWVFFSHFKF